MSFNHLISRRTFLGKAGVFSAGLLASSGSFSTVMAATRSARAEVVYRNGRIYTVNPLQPWVQAVAVTQGVIQAVGSNDDIRSLASKKTKVVDLDGAFVMPGFIDTHCHPHFLYRDQFADRLTISPKDSQAKVVAAIKAYAAKHKDGWIAGQHWGTQNFPNGMLTRDILDKAAPGRPILLIEASGHNAAASSKALELAGIKKGTPQPATGSFAVDNSGEPNGYLSDYAVAMVGQKLPGPSEAIYRKAVTKALDEMRSKGVTTIGDMSCIEPVYETYHGLDRSGDLKLKVQAALGMNSLGRHLDGDWEANPQGLVPKLSYYESRLVDPRNCKWWMDGLPSGGTSLMLEPYSNDPKSHGDMTLTDAEVEDMRRYDRMGLRLHFHTVGDGTTRQVLDTMALLRADNPANPVRHHLAHLCWVDDSDMQRFKTLNLVGDISPSIWFPNGLMDGFYKAVGKERMSDVWPVGRFEEMGIPVSYGSDWGSSGQDCGVIRALESLVTRKDPYGKRSKETLGLPVDLEMAIRMVTINGAHTMQIESSRGSIEVGKYADMVVLSENLLDLVKAGHPDELSAANVLKTIFEGQVTYEA